MLADVVLYPRRMVKKNKFAKIKEFFNYCNSGKIQEAYNLLSEECKEELFNLRFSQATGNLEKPSRIRELRKLVARMKTILRERELKEN